MKDYDLLYEQVLGYIIADAPRYSILSNITAVLDQMDDINWVGLYFVEGDDLFVGPFQGEVACMKIEKGKGVCGTSFQQKKTVIVPNVNKFPGHIACSSASRSEIVVPLRDGKGDVFAVLDIDSANTPVTGLISTSGSTSPVGRIICSTTFLDFASS